MLVPLNVQGVLISCVCGVRACLGRSELNLSWCLRLCCSCVSVADGWQRCLGVGWGGGGGKRSVVWAFSEPRQSSCITNGVFFPGLYQKQCFLYSYVTTIWCKLSILTQCLTTETHLSHMVWLSWGKSRDGSEYLRSHRKLLASRRVCSPSINPKAPPYYIFSSRCLINGLCGEPLLSDAALFLLLTCLLNVSVPPSAYTSH